MAKAPYNTRAWQRVRLQVLERDGHTCRVGLNVCTIEATTAHHVTPVSRLHPRDPALLDPTNIVAACIPCNSAMRDRTTPPPGSIGPRRQRRDRPRPNPLVTTRTW